MSNLKKTYFLCPNWDYHPDGPVQLGNIIASPESPAYALSGFERRPPTEGTLFPTTIKSGVTWSEQRSRSGKFHLWTEFLSFIHGLGVDVGIDHSLSLDQSYHFDSITTTEFQPTPEDLAQSMSATAVVDFLSRNRFRKHVYMITALKIVHGVKAKTERGRSTKGNLGATVGAASAGGEISGEGSDGMTHSFEGSSDFVFAYRLRKVIIHRSGHVEDREHRKGAMFDSEAQQMASQQLPYVVEGIEEQDASAQDFGYGRSDELVDGDDHCVCVWPELD